MEKEYINEVVWKKVFSFLKNYKSIYTGNEARCKKFIEAIFWMARTGAQWRELHDKYGKWNTIYSRFNSWSKKHVWNKLLEFCATEPDLEYVMIDTTIIRAHACSAGYGNQDLQGLGRSRGGFTSKIHAKVDALGNPLKFIITPGECNDFTQAETLIAGISNTYIIADKGYSFNTFHSQVIAQNCKPVIPPKKNMINPWKYDKYIYKERHVIECFFSKIKQFRRIFSRFDKSAQNFVAFLSFVGAILWLR